MIQEETTQRIASSCIMESMRKLLFILVLIGAVLPARAADDYLCDFKKPLKFYQYLHWQPYEFPINVYISDIPTKLTVDDRGMYKEVVEEAFERWSSESSMLEFNFVSNPRKANIRVTWRNYFESESRWGEALYPRPFQRGKKLYHESEIHLALRAQPGTASFSNKAVLFSRDELLALATHEVGHAIGLPHSKNPDDIMSPRIFRLSTANDWSITSRDIATLERLYSITLKTKKSPCK